MFRWVEVLRHSEKRVRSKHEMEPNGPEGIRGKRDRGSPWRPPSAYPPPHFGDHAPIDAEASAVPEHDRLWCDDGKKEYFPGARLKTCATTIADRARGLRSFQHCGGTRTGLLTRKRQTNIIPPIFRSLVEDLLRFLTARFMKVL
jgi:hypothetical protein